MFQHCIDIVHTSTKRPFTQSQLTVYIDGRPKLGAQIKYPMLTDVSHFELLSFLQKANVWMQKLKKVKVFKKFLKKVECFSETAIEVPH